MQNTNWHAQPQPEENTHGWFAFLNRVRLGERQELVVACAEGESIPYFRRRHERVDCRLPVRVSIGKGRKLDSTAVDISEGGVGLVTDHALLLKMHVILSATLPSKKRISLRGRVVSVIPKGPQQGVGVEFVFESVEQRGEMADQVALLRSRRLK